MNQQRYLSIDILKGMGMIYLICVHVMVWLHTDFHTGEIIYPKPYIFYSLFKLTGFHVLGFQIPLLAGITFFIHIKTKGMKMAVLIQRVVMLVLLGYAMNFLTWGPYDLFDWDVLQFIAFSMIIVYPILRWLSQRIGMVIFLILGVIAVCMSNQYPYLQLHNSYFYVMVFGDVSGEHYWPFLPWFALYVTGLFIGQIYLSNDKKKFKMIAFVGLFLVIHSFISGKFYPVINFSNMWGQDIFKPSPYFITGIIGGSLVWISITSIVLSKIIVINMKFEKFFLSYFGAGILWIYLFTTVFGYHMTRFAQIYISPHFENSLGPLMILIVINVLAGYCIGKHIFVTRKITYSPEHYR